MLARVNKYLIIILFAALAITFGLTLKHVQKNSIKPASPQNLPDFFINEAIYLQMNNEGIIINKLSTPKITHLPEENLTVFENPNIEIQDNAKKIWQITAGVGKSKSEAKIIELTQKINISKHAKIGDIPILKIATETMTYLPREKYAVTQDPLVITRQDSIVKANGAKINFEEGLLELVSQVKAQLIGVF